MNVYGLISLESAAILIIKVRNVLINSNVLYSCVIIIKLDGKNEEDNKIRLGKQKMIKFSYKIDFKKAGSGIEEFFNSEIKQGEAAMAILALERFKKEILNIEFDNEGISINEDEN